MAGPQDVHGRGFEEGVEQFEIPRVEGVGEDMGKVGRFDGKATAVWFVGHGPSTAVPNLGGQCARQFSVSSGFSHETAGGPDLTDYGNEFGPALCGACMMQVISAHRAT